MTTTKDEINQTDFDNYFYKRKLERYFKLRPKTDKRLLRYCVRYYQETKLNPLFIL